MTLIKYSEKYTKSFGEVYSVLAGDVIVEESDTHYIICKKDRSLINGHIHKPYVDWILPLVSFEYSVPGGNNGG